MLTSDHINNWQSLIAASADHCIKPWKHSVVNNTFNADIDELNQFLPEEINVRIECRSLEGTRHPENDLELEIYKSGNDMNLMLSWVNKPNNPILWQGKHSFWIDSTNGIKCDPPPEFEPLELLARKLITTFSNL